MGTKVFANGREISCKASSGKTICAMPDVCFTPPENPATPPGVPIPYPNTGFASDTTDGSKSVKISKKEVGLKNKSCFKKSTGDEAGSAAKKGIITSKNTGKVFFESWSMDVKIEGKNAVRHLDMTTNNHASTPGDTPPWAYVADMSVDGHSCAQIVSEIHPYDEKDCETGDQSHHIIDNASLTMEGARRTALKNILESDAVGRAKRNLFQPGSGHPGESYDEKKAPCICLEGDMAVEGTEHNIAHTHTSNAAESLSTSDGKWNYQQARDNGAESIQEAKGLEDWEAECMKLVLDAYFNGFSDSTEMRAPGQDCTASHFNDGSGNLCQASELIGIG